MQQYQKYIEKWTPETVGGDEKTWLSSRDWFWGQYLQGTWCGPRKALRPLQMMHGWLPTRSKMAQREYPGPDGELCPACGVKETTWHAMGLCTHGHSVTARD